MSFISDHHHLHDNAYRESLKTGDTKQQFGCLITNRHIVARGHNYRSFDNLSCCCHAEMEAIYRHLKSLSKWEAFKDMLNASYRQIGILTRTEGKAS